MNDRTPPDVTEKNASSAPVPAIEKFRVSPGRSASIAVAVPTAVVFSSTVNEDVDVKTGVLSFTGSTVTAILWIVVFVPSETSTSTS